MKLTIAMLDLFKILLQKENISNDTVFVFYRPKVKKISHQTLQHSSSGSDDDNDHCDLQCNPKSRSKQKHVREHVDARNKIIFK